MKTLNKTLLLILILSLFAYASSLEDKAFNAYKNRDYITSFKLYTQAAKSNSLKAFLMLGLFYEKGISVKKDTTKAIKLYKYILKKTFHEFQPPLNNVPISIIALGSYGREQLSIYSDIDIMIVYKDIKGYNLKEIIENYITMLWDLGLKIGHRVHEINDLFPARCR